MRRIVDGVGLHAGRGGGTALAAAVAVGIAGMASLCAGAARAQPPADPRQIITLQVENDAVSTAQGTSDQYYTSGLRLGWVGATDQTPGFLARAGQGVFGDGVDRVSLDISQTINTPRNTQARFADPHDQPYAGQLMVTGRLIHDRDDQRIVAGLGLGLIGPGAGGEEVQNGFHDLIGDTRNRGWRRQLRDEPVAQVQASSIWRLPITQFCGLETDALPTVGGDLGNARTAALGGVTFRIGQGLRTDYGVSRTGPGMNGTDSYMPVRDFAWYAFAGLDGQAVVHDALLDGNSWRANDDPHVSKKWAVGEFTAGAAVIWQGVRVSYTHTFQTERFNGQKGGLFNFGSLTGSVAF